MLVADIRRKVAKERLGDSRTTLTLDTRSRVLPDMGASAAELVDAAVRKAVKPKA